MTMMIIMAKHEPTFWISLLPLLHIILLSNVILNYSGATQLQSSQSSSLLRIKELLNHPTVLTSWNNNTDFCNTEPTSSVTVVCYEETITQLHIIGPSLRGGGGNGPLLPPNFSIDSFVTTLVKLPTLKVLTLVSLGLWGPLPANISRLSSLEILNISSNHLNGSVPHEISSLQNLQTLILDHNLFSGPLLPADAFPALAVLSLRNNSFHGSLPQSSLAKLRDLRVLDLAFNHFLGQVPDLSGLANLEHLDLENNSFGPQFPRLGSKLVTLSLKGNKFRSGVLDEELRPCYQLQKLDISSNKLMGPLPAASLLSLPSLAYLNVSRNKFTGMLFSNMSCDPGGLLKSVDLSSNLLTGSLPKCLVDDDGTAPVVLYGDNCMSTKEQGQHPYAFCRNEALAVGVLPNPRKKNGSRINTKAVAVVCGVVLGAAGGMVLLAGLVYLWWLLRTKRLLRKTSILQTRSPGLIGEHAPANTYTRKLLSDARYISQTMKLGALGVQAYRTFSLEELEEATNNFDSSAFMGEGSHGQMYRGELKDGSFVAVRCVKLKKSTNTCTQQFMPLVELISKLRHRHLVSAIGHCFECYLEDSSVSRLFLVFEYVPNGTLTSWIVDTSSSSARNSNNNGQESQQQHQQRSRHLLSWSQRITTAIGVAKGIQFLHTGIVPGIFSNNLKTTDVLLDQNLIAKISSYNLPLLAAAADNIIVGKVRTTEGAAASGSPKDLKPKYADEEDKSDVYDFGVILLEMIVGRSIKTKNELNAFRNQVQAGAVLDEATRRSIAAPEIEDVCSDQSLKTMMEICSRCMNKDPAERPSIEDILWNLQFAAQVQDAWQRDSSRSSSSSSSSRGSPAVSPPSHQLPRLPLALQ